MNRVSAIPLLLFTLTLSAQTPSDTVLPAAVDSPSLSPALPKKTPVIFNGTAPAGGQVTLGGQIAQADSSGRWSAVLMLDSASRADSAFDLCLQLGLYSSCTRVRARGYDTLELAPLALDTSAYEHVAPADTTPSPAVSNPQMIDQGKASAGRTVTVRAKRPPPRAVGQSRMTSDEVKRLPTLAEPDVIRAVQTLPGVVASSDFSTKLYVRGSSSDQNLVLFDNAVVYSPMHFGGLFSTFLADATGDIDFYKGGFDPKYGNRLSSVLLVNGKTGGATADSGNPGETWVDGNARLTTLSGSLEVDGRKGPLSWVVAGRRTWIDQALAAARSAGITDLKLPYFFYDIQGGVTLGVGADTARLSVYQGRDNLELAPFIIDWGNSVIPLYIKKKLTPELTHTAVFSRSSFDQTFGFGDILSLENGIVTWNTRQELSYRGIAGHLLTGGYEYNLFEVHFAQLSKIFNISNLDDYREGLHAGFAQDRWVLNPKYTVTGGLRTYYYPALHHTGLDPRATFTWRPVEDMKYDFHAGLYHQYLTSIRWTDQETFNEFWYAVKSKMKPSVSGLLSAGLEKTGLGRWGLTTGVEVYYKNIEDLPLFYPNQTQGEVKQQDQVKPEIASYFTSLDGYAAGTELSVKKEGGPVSGEVSYGLSKAVLLQEPFTTSLGTTTFKPYSADWDQRHTLKSTVHLNWRGEKEKSFWTSKKKGWYLRTTFQLNFHSGLPFTQFEDYYRVHEPDQGANGISGSGPPIYLEDNLYLRQGRRNAATRDYYFRLDATAIDWGREGKFRLYFTAINLTDRENIFLINYDTSKNPPEKEVVTQLPFLPILLGLEYQF